MYRRFFKHLFDFIISLVVTVVLSPVILITAVVLAIANKGNPFFLQKRPGLNNKIFTLIKFRTMNNRRDIAGNLLPDDMRLTKVGSIVRKLSLDELLQLINVLKGDMSIVGPRPLLVQYLPLYSAEQLRRHEVRPGITGWAQVNGRNTISWQQKFTLDVWYVDHLSFSLDMKIIWLTVLKVLRREGINQSGTATVEYFKGNNN